LVQTHTTAARRSSVAVKVAIAARAFDQIENAVGHGIAVPEKTATYISGRANPVTSDAATRAALYSLSHSGLFQAASAFRKTFNLKGRNFRFEYTAKTGICGEAHFGNSRMSAPLASASSQ
jgi:hypothetical protein